MADHQGVAVGRGLGDGPRAQCAGGAGTIVDHELLAERAAHVLSQHARHHVVAAAGRERHHDHDRAGRIGLRCRVSSSARNACNKQHGNGAVLLPHWLLPGVI
jgi:hypothetical protein